MVVEAIQYNAANLEHYVLHAFVVMPNHLHLLATPSLPLPKLTKSLKGITSKRANTILAMTGSCFWQEERGSQAVLGSSTTAYAEPPRSALPPFTERATTTLCEMSVSSRRSRVTSRRIPCAQAWCGRQMSIGGRARHG
jgi:hypothetical protein